jgi:hypothetical protein
MPPKKNLDDFLGMTSTGARGDEDEGEDGEGDQATCHRCNSLLTAVSNCNAMEPLWCLYLVD